MGDLSGILGLVGTGVSAGAGMYGSISQAGAQGQQGYYAQQFAELNARSQEMQAADAIARGDQAILRHGLSTRALIGAQRASAAGQGVSVNAGSPLALQNDAAKLSAMDDQTLRMNAYKEAMGYRMGASNQRFQGTMQNYAAQSNASNTLLAGGLGAGRTIMGGVDAYYRNTPPLVVPHYGYAQGDETFF